jgi:transcriptional regulator with XRE-family HTH domain
VRTRLQVERRMRGLSVRALSRASGVSFQCLHHLETGRRAGRETTWRQIADALGVPVEYLRARACGDRARAKGGQRE